MKKFIRITALSLSSVLLFCSCNSTKVADESNLATYEDDTEYFGDLTLSGTDFSEIKYERYDDTEINKLIEECRGKIDDSSNASDVISLFKQIVDEEQKLGLAYQLAEIYNSIDANDEYYQDEYTAMSKMATDVGDAADTLGKDILNSACGDAAREQWEAEDVEYYENYTELTDEQKELNEKENQLIVDYNEASVKEYTTTISFKTYTLDDLYSADDITSTQYYKGYDDILEQMNEDLGPIYVDLVKVRQELAKSLGYDSYTDYIYEEVYDRDYTPDQAQELCDSVKKYLPEVYENVYSNYDYETTSGLGQEVEAMGLSGQMSSIEAYLSKVDSILPESWDFMEKYHLYNLEYDDDKMDAGFTTFLPVYNEPFLFNQPEGDFYDYMSIVHEFGHFNSYCINGQETNGSSNLDLAEIHSQGLEMLYTNFYKEIFGEEYGQAAIDYNMLMKLATLSDGCMYDEFQREVYDTEEITLDKVNEIYSKVVEDYGSLASADISGYEWVEIPHNYQSPLYYISYAVSVLPTYEIWEMSLTDFDKACDVYMDVVRLGEDDEYVATLKKAGLTSPFDDGYIKNLTETINDYYGF